MTARFADHILAEGNLAARPAAGSVPPGTLYPATDAGIIYRNDGAAWQPWATLGGGIQSIVPGANISVDNTDPANPVVSATGSGGGGGSSSERPLVDPTGLAWSWINQRSCSIATQGASLLLSSPADSADSWSFRAKAVPAKPYSIIAHMKISMIDISYSGACVGWIDSASSKFAILSQRSGHMIESLKGETSGTWGATSAYSQANTQNLFPWIKLTDDATNRRIYVSQDGYNWILFSSVATNTTITPDKVCFGIEARNSQYGMGVMLDSWEEAA